MKLWRRVAPQAREVLEPLVGTTIYTVSQRKPNQVVAIDQEAVHVDTGEGPKPVPLDDVQNGLDKLFAEGEVRVSVPTLGHRSAFVGAVLATLPGAATRTGPAYVSLSRMGSALGARRRRRKLT